MGLPGSAVLLWRRIDINAMQMRVIQYVLMFPTIPVPTMGNIAIVLKMISTKMAPQKTVNCKISTVGTQPPPMGLLGGAELPTGFEISSKLR